MTAIPSNYIQFKGQYWHPAEFKRVFGADQVPVYDRTDLPQKPSKSAGQETSKRIRQSSKPEMNKLETRFLDHLKALYPSMSLYTQSIRFKLGNGIHYKPDVFTPVFEDSPACWEVKGEHAFRGGFENLKVAASKYPDFKWFLVWEQCGHWQEQLVLP